MAGAGAGHAAGQDLRTLGHVTAQAGDILVIDALHAVSTEAADLAATLAGAGAGTLEALGLFDFISHEIILLVL
jgi:hypothetical protein